MKKIQKAEEKKENLYDDMVEEDVIIELPTDEVQEFIENYVNEHIENYI